MVKESDKNSALTNPDALDDEIYFAGSDDEQILLDEATGGSSDVDDASADLTFDSETINGGEETSDTEQKNENEEMSKIEKKRKRRLKDKERKVWHEVVLGSPT
ncbi:hypothetical protein BKA69DRAFT_1038874 [Paraphysoderma sedebokerense]|nr:hypothetical protein BKA69DRAFT_1038874 [Paraphysoderma sedebokerense]